MKQTNIQVIRESIGKIVSMLTSQRIKVTQRGVRAYVAYRKSDGSIESVNIPYLPDDATPDFIAAVQGFLDHEVGHVLFTDQKVVAKAHKLGKRAANMANIIEDIFVERKMGEAFQGSNANLESVRHFFLEKMIRPKILESLSAGDTDQATARVIVPAFRAWAGQASSQDFIKDPAFAALVEPLRERIGEDLIKKLQRLDSSQACLDLALLVKKALENPPAPPAPPATAPPPPPAAPPAPSPNPPPPEDDEGEHESGEGSEPADAENPGQPSDTENNTQPSQEKTEHTDPTESSSDSEDDQPESDEDNEGDQDQGDDGSEPAASSTPAEQDDDGNDRQPASCEDSAAGDSQNQSDARGSDGDGEGDGDDADGDAAGDGEGDEDDAAGGGGQSFGDSDGESPPVTPGGGPGSDDDAPPIAKNPERDLSEHLDTVTDFDQEVSEGLTKESARQFTSSDYRIYSTEWDKIEVAPNTKGLTAIASLEQGTEGTLGVMQKQLERAVAAQARKAWNPAQRRGRIAPGGLFKTSTGDDRVFRTRTETKAKNTAITLLVDCSGSMVHSGSITIAARAAFALSSVLERIKISHEIIGFTTYESREMEAAMRADATTGAMPDDFARDEAIYMPVFKGFNERLTSEVKGRLAGLIGRPGFCRYNIDGESIQIAAHRLKAQRAERHVLMVLSDGDPNCSPAGPSLNQLRSHTRKAVRDAEARGVECIGIGIQSTAVKGYYDKHVVLNDLEQLPTTVMGQLTKILLSP